MTAHAAPSLTAAAVTRLVRKATGSDLFTSRAEPALGVVRVSQQYAVAGALTPTDTSARRDARARAAAAALIQAGYEVARTGDRLTVTLPEPEAGEPVEVEAPAAVVVDEQGGELRQTEHGARYLTAAEVAALPAEVAPGLAAHTSGRRSRPAAKSRAEVTAQVEGDELTAARRAVEAAQGDLVAATEAEQLAKAGDDAREAKLSSRRRRAAARRLARAQAALAAGDLD